LVNQLFWLKGEILPILALGNMPKFGQLKDEKEIHSSQLLGHVCFQVFAGFYPTEAKR